MVPAEAVMAGKGVFIGVDFSGKPRFLAGNSGFDRRLSSPIYDFCATAKNPRKSQILV